MNPTKLVIPTDFDPYSSSSKINPFSWICPYCGRTTTITSNDATSCAHVNKLLPENNTTVFTSIFIKCPNPDCGEISLFAKENKLSMLSAKTMKFYKVGDVLQSFQITPKPKPKAWPNDVPLAVREDYSEAFLICELSPKASATLSRRCLQGIIRDVWKVKPNNLSKEIDQIQDRVRKETLDIITLIRKFGNIGAHMEKDINMIINIEPNEAHLLVELVEALIQEWYIDDPKKEKLMKNLKTKIEEANLKK